MNEGIESELIVGIINLQSRIQKRIGNQLSAHGIGLSEYLVLQQLHCSQNQTMRRSDLAEAVGLSPSGVTRLLLPMEKIGLVAREESPRDARVSLVAITEAGKRIFGESKVTFEYASKTFLGALDGNRIKLFTDLLGEISG